MWEKLYQMLGKQNKSWVKIKKGNVSKDVYV